LKPKFAQVPEQSDFTYGVYLVAAGHLLRVNLFFSFVAGAISRAICEMDETQIAETVAKIKAAFLRFFVSLMVRYQDLMILPPSRYYDS